MQSFQKRLRICAALAVTLALSACGGGSSGGGAAALASSSATQGGAAKDETTGTAKTGEPNAATATGDADVRYAP